MTIFLAFVPSDRALCLRSLSPHLPLSSTASAIASGMQSLEQDRRRNLPEGRALVLPCFLHQMYLPGYIRDASHTIPFLLPQGSLDKKAREAIHRLYLQIPVFIKIDCGAHMKSPFLWFLPALVRAPSLSAVLVPRKVSLECRKANPSSFCSVAVAVLFLHLCSHRFVAEQQLWRAGFCFM